ncbi:MAG: FAD-binding oxidoreductase [Lautropia sp.]|nr:FAD-binding oxidoreductase [Lautropia sp.]
MPRTPAFPPPQDGASDGQPGGTATLLTSLRGAFSGRILTEPADTDAFLWDYRRRWHGPAFAVVQPDTPADVAAVVRWCRDHDHVVVPQGGNTGLTGASVPQAQGTAGTDRSADMMASAGQLASVSRPAATASDATCSAGQPAADRHPPANDTKQAPHRPAVLLSLTRLNRVRRVDPIDSTMVVEAGCTLLAAQQAAEAHDRLFPLSLASEGSCTVGGNLATNAGGVQVLRYGTMRELCLGLEVVTADGEIWNGLSGLRKNNTGYDLRDLFIGSEGTLGIITAAVLKLHPCPRGRVAALASVTSAEQALALLAHAQSRLASELTAFELISRAALSLVLKHMPGSRLPLAALADWQVLLEVSSLKGEDEARTGLEAMLAEASEAGLLTDAAVSMSVAQFRQFWALRENISAAQTAEGRNIKHDISVPISRIGEFLRAAEHAIRAEFPQAQPIVFGHLGDGNLHFNVTPGARHAAAYDDDFTQKEAAINRITHDCVAAHGGAISAEHGIGVLRRTELARYKQPLELQMMRAIKQALDPQNRMNPGKLLPE